MSGPFDRAKFYDCGDPQELKHADPGEAVEEFLDSNWAPDISPQQLLDELCPVTVKAYAPKTVAPRFGESAIDSMLEDFEENYWCEEYGNPMECGSPPWEGEQLRALRDKLYAALAEALKHAYVWQCEVVATREFTKQEVRSRWSQTAV